MLDFICTDWEKIITWAEEDADNQRNSRDEGRAYLKPPRDRPSVVNGQVGTETKKYAKGGPHLPAHNQPSTNRSRTVLCSEDGNGRRFAAHTYSHENPSNKKLRPSLTQTRADDREETENSSNEDRGSSAKVEV
jgi:hypothetical protein